MRQIAHQWLVVAGFLGLGLCVLLNPILGWAGGSSPPGNTHNRLLKPQEAIPGTRQNREIQVAKDAGAQRLNLPDFNTYAVYWFPDDYATQGKHRVLFVLHGSKGNAYQGIYHQLASARKNGYGVVALQWWLGDGNYMQPKSVETALYKAYQALSKTYPVDTGRIALETFSRSGSISYEVAYWNRILRHPSYRLVVVQSGGIPQDHPRPLVRSMIAGQLGPGPLSGYRFFMYCGERDEEWGAQMCENMRYAKQVVTQAGAQVVRFIDDPDRGHGGMHNTPSYLNEEVTTFLSLTN